MRNTVFTHQFINMFEMDWVDAMVNPVNTVGVMGRGLAKQFATAYPEIVQPYKAECAKKTLKIGTINVNHLAGRKPPFIINFPTKQHWSKPSKIDYISIGMPVLAYYVRTHAISTISIPALGCGLGGLRWDEVSRIIQSEDFGNCNVFLFPPI